MNSRFCWVRGPVVVDHVDHRRATEVEAVGGTRHHAAQAVVAVEGPPVHLVGRVRGEQGDPPSMSSWSSVRQ